MIDETTFRHESDNALESLKQALFRSEEAGGFETDEKNGVLNILFEDGAAKFVFTPNTPVRQVWISALSTSYKLEWDETAHAFTLPKTGEDLLHPHPAPPPRATRRPHHHPRLIAPPTSLPGNRLHQTEGRRPPCPSSPSRSSPSTKKKI